MWVSQRCSSMCNEGKADILKRSEFRNVISSINQTSKQHFKYEQLSICLLSRTGINAIVPCLQTTADLLVLNLY